MPLAISRNSDDYKVLTGIEMCFFKCNIPYSKHESKYHTAFVKPFGNGARLFRQNKVICGHGIGYNVYMTFASTRKDFNNLVPSHCREMITKFKHNLCSRKIVQYKWVRNIVICNDYLNRLYNPGNKTHPESQFNQRSRNNKNDVFIKPTKRQFSPTAGCRNGCVLFSDFNGCVAMETMNQHFWESNCGN